MFCGHAHVGHTVVSRRFGHIALTTVAISSAIFLLILTLATQVHGTGRLRAPLTGPSGQADALYTTEPGTAVGVRTADCVPLLLVDRGRRAVAAIHAGWRGSAAGIAERTVLGLQNELGVEPEAWIVVVGPHIGPCCYEVDEPVRQAVADGRVVSAADRPDLYRLDEPVRRAVADPRVFSAADRPGHYFLNLFELNRLQLLRAGVAAERIYRVGDCTYCHGEVYQSYRRDGTAGRMMHYVRMPRD